MEIKRKLWLAAAILVTISWAAALTATGTAIKVGKAPNFICLLPGGNRAVVTNFGSNDMSVLQLDAAKPEVKRVPAGYGPLGIVLGIDGQRLFVTNKDSGMVKEFRLPDLELVESYKVGNVPTDITATPDGYSLLVANFGKGKWGRVDVLDLQKKRVTESIKVGVRPLAIVANSSGTIAYVANSAGNTLSVISLEVYKVLETIPVGDGPIGLAINRNGRKLFIAHSRSNDLWVYDLRRKTVLHKIALPAGPFRIAISPDQRLLAIPWYQANQLAVLDADAAEGATIYRLAVKQNPVDAVFTADGTSILVTCEGDDRVVVVPLPEAARPKAAPEPAAPSGEDDRHE
jgi:YVTN family beta-propeller protein